MCGGSIKKVGYPHAGNRLMLVVESLDYSATTSATSATTVSTALLSAATVSTTAATTSSAATTVSQQVLSQALSALLALPQENMVALKATASKRTNFFISFFELRVKQYCCASKTMQSYSNFL
jgi:hypothetical protein